jgi:hypothetical protein
MTKEFVPYELAVKLKQLGFDEECFCNWEESWSPEPEDEIRMVLTTDQTWLRPGWVRAPTFSQAFRWFREKHNLISIITTTPSFDTMYASKYKSHTYYQFQPFKWVDGKYLINDTYEEAELACLDKLIKIVETKQQEQ